MAKGRTSQSGTMDEPVRYHVADIDTAPVREMRDSRGQRTLLVHPGLGATKVDVHINRIHAGDPGGRFHLHQDAENVYIVLKGTGIVQIDQKEIAVSPGKVVFIAPGVPHGVQNIGDDVLELIEIYAPAPPDFTLVERPDSTADSIDDTKDGVPDER